MREINAQLIVSATMRLERPRPPPGLIQINVTQPA
jgi:hypothetical protein